MKKVLTISLALALSSSAAFSQGITDAYKYTLNGSDLQGTARSMAMAGAFGALGGDISVLNHNPAGLGVYRSSEIATTLDITTIESKNNWFGNQSNSDKTRFNFDNIAYMGYFPTGSDDGLVSWNVGFSYNRLKNYHRNYKAAVSGSNGSSLSDYIAARANANGLTPDDLNYQSSGDVITYDPYEHVNDWLSILGNCGGFMDYNNGKFSSNLNTSSYQRSYTELNVEEKGAIDQYAIGFGGNFSDFLMLGASVTITDLDYSMYSYYAEDYNKQTSYTSYIQVQNNLKTEGTGYGINVGAIIRPLNFLRFGIAYNSPTWYKMTDYYFAKSESDIQSLKDKYYDESPNNAYTDYKYRTPDKWIFSAAAIIGQTALVSVDYETMNYRRMRMYDANGNENSLTNTGIEQSFGISNTIKAGTEIKITPQFAVRAGVAWTGSAIGSGMKNGETEVVTVGTIPNYTVNRDIVNYTVGLGYRFTPQLYADIACIYKTAKEDVYAFSPLFDNSGKTIIEANSSSLKTNSTRIALTIGYKF